jgi:hypothetical protein
VQHQPADDKPIKLNDDQANSLQIKENESQLAEEGNKGEEGEQNNN